MTSTIDTARLHAFIDGELDLANRLELEARLAHEPGLREQVDGLRQLSATVREQAHYHAAPEALRLRIAALAGPPPAERPARPQAAAERPARPRAARATLAQAVDRWFGWRPLSTAFALASVMTLALHLAVLQPSADERLLDDVVASHVRSTLGEHLVDVASSDHHTVKPWLSSRLDFSPPVHELGLPGSVFVGGRVDYLDGRPVAALVYRQGQHIVNAFVWRDAERDSAPRFVNERGYQAAHWSRAGMAHWVISDLDPAEFGKVVAALDVADGAGR